MFPCIRAAMGVAGAALVGFHAWLFAAQLAAGRLEDPWLIVRWLSAFVLLAALWVVRRGGHSIVGRHGVAIWVLAALLHGPVIAGKINSDALALPETLAASVLQVVSSAALAISLWVLAGVLAARRSQVRRLTSVAHAFGAAAALAAGIALHFSPRPPPLRS